MGVPFPPMIRTAIPPSSEPVLPEASVLRVRASYHVTFVFALGLCLGLRGLSGETVANSAGPTPDAGGSATDHSKLQLLPKEITDGLYVDLWGWGSYLYVDHGDHRSNWDGELSLDVTKSFAGRVAMTAQFNAIDASGHVSGDLEQAFISALLSDATQTVFTVGKFNASVGVEARDPWHRLNGTTSLLFSAEPQDMIGAQILQPLGDTGITLRPFVTTNFDGQAHFVGGASGGLIVQYQPVHELTLALANWVGPGFKQAEEDDEENPGEYGGAAVIENWMGPNLHGDNGGTLYFVNGNATWTPRNDITVEAQALLANTNSADGNAGWQGCLLLGNYDINDQFRVFGRWSFLNDSAGIVTGLAQRLNELSAGVACKIYRKIELRGEYRHDFSSVNGDTDSVSIHLTFGF
jgi:hypothetical protein